MAGKGNQPKIEPMNPGTSTPWNDPEAMQASQLVEARKLDFKIHGNSTYSDEIAESICVLIAEGHTLRQACREMGLHQTTVHRWLAMYKNFGELYVRASQIKLLSMADDILEIADDSRNDWIERESKSGQVYEVPDHEVVNRSKLRVDTRKWLLTKLMPKTFGDKVTVDVNDKHASALQAARLRLAQRKQQEEERENAIDAEAVHVADDSSIPPADVIEVDPADVLDEPIA